MTRLVLLGMVLGLGDAADPRPDLDQGPFVHALRLSQTRGDRAAASPFEDARVKARLARAFGKTGRLDASKISGVFDPSHFEAMAGPDGVLDATELKIMVDRDVPTSRSMLIPSIRDHADRLSTSLDRIEPRHREAGEELANWIVQHHKPGRPLHVIVVCTGNSRRSLLGAIMGNIAAAYHGMPEIRFHSGGTAPTAFNSRTIRALKGIGVEVVPTGKEAPRGEPMTENPTYRVRWGGEGSTLPVVEEFSKRYGDPVNPSSGFAALMVCDEADAACPVVKGASARIAIPFLDPKAFDGSPYEAEKYEERRDDLGRWALAVFARVRQIRAGIHTP